MNRKAFFDSVRNSLFGGQLKVDQVKGMEAIIDGFARNGASDMRHKAYILATAYHETAFTMQPIHERGSRSYFDKYERDTNIGRALGNTLPNDGYRFRGRGFVQITGRSNYAKASRLLGVDLLANPDAALNMDYAVVILIDGMIEGWFTGKKLADFQTYEDMRRVVNGTDRAKQIAQYAVKFEKALIAADATPSAKTSWWSALWAAIALMFNPRTGR